MPSLADLCFLEIRTAVPLAQAVTSIQINAVELYKATSDLDGLTVDRLEQSTKRAPGTTVNSCARSSPASSPMSCVPC